MPIFSLFVLIFSFFLAQAQDETSDISEVQVQSDRQQMDKKKSVVNDMSSENIHYDIHGEFALESKKVNLGTQRDNNQPMIQNFSIGVDIFFSQHLQATLEVLGEQQSDSTDVSFGETFLQYQLSFYDQIQFRLGNMYYNYGLMTSEEGLLSRRPAYYVDLLVSRRGLDVGAQATWQLFQKIPLQLSYSYFSGRTLRMGDEKIEPPELEPQYAQLLYMPSWGNWRLTYLNRHFVSRPRLKALGLDFKSIESCFGKARICFQGGFEAWSFDYKRTDGLEQNGLTASLQTELSVFGFFHRFILAREDWSHSRLDFSGTRGDFYLHGFGYKINSYVHVEYQNIRATEASLDWRLISANEDVYRVYLKF